MKIVKTEIIDDGQRLQIETDDDSDYKFIWIDTSDLLDVVAFLESMHK